MDPLKAGEVLPILPEDQLWGDAFSIRTRSSL